jgi:hypothetical protein
VPGAGVLDLSAMAPERVLFACQDARRDFFLTGAADRGELARWGEGLLRGPGVAGPKRWKTDRRLLRDS